VIEAALNCGAVGFAMKAGPPYELIRAIEMVARGETYADATLARLANETPPPPLLSPRERQVLQLLAQGLTGEDAAKRLYLSPETIRTHVRNAITKLGAHTRVHAVTIALQRGEVEL
jgi:DNA-binding NarL/FixJ family response regulator